MNSREVNKRAPFGRTVNTTVCDPEDYWTGTDSRTEVDGGGGDDAARISVIERWHPHRRINRESHRALVHPHMSRKHRRNLKVLD